MHVSFKTKLTDKATDVSAEFKPLLPADRPGAQRQTDPQGVQFMLSYPDVEAGPNFEIWDNENEDGGPDAGWNRAKVEKDIKEVKARKVYRRAGNLHNWVSKPVVLMVMSAMM